MKFILYLSFESWDNFSAVRFSYFTQLVVYMQSIPTSRSLALCAAANIILHLIQEHFFFLCCIPIHNTLDLIKTETHIIVKYIP